MSDVNKIIAAILTVGRVPTMGGNPRPMDDWLAEYEAWVEALDRRDGDTQEDITNLVPEE